MLAEGTRIAIPCPGLETSDQATHQVTGHDLRGRRSYLLVCPIDRLDTILPGQDWVPVTRIEEHRVEIRN